MHKSFKFIFLLFFVLILAIILGRVADQFSPSMLYYFLAFSMGIYMIYQGICGVIFQQMTVVWLDDLNFKGKDATFFGLLSFALGFSIAGVALYNIYLTFQR